MRCIFNDKRVKSWGSNAHICVYFYQRRVFYWLLSLTFIGLKSQTWSVDFTWPFFVLCLLFWLELLVVGSVWSDGALAAFEEVKFLISCWSSRLGMVDENQFGFLLVIIIKLVWALKISCLFLGLGCFFQFNFQNSVSLDLTMLLKDSLVL